MRPFLIILTLLVFAADLWAFVRFRKWLGQLEQHPDEPLSAGQERRLQGFIKLLSVLSAAWSLLVLLLIFL